LLARLRMIGNVSLEKHKSGRWNIIYTVIGQILAVG
jgi:hypothetical protein